MSVLRDGGRVRNQRRGYHVVYDCSVGFVPLRAIVMRFMLEGQKPMHYRRVRKELQVLGELMKELDAFLD